MVSKEINFKCDICNELHKTLIDAQTCESRGRPKLYPIGMIFGLPQYDNIVFAIIKQIPDSYPHSHSYYTWACRDTYMGDNTGGKNYCGLESWTEISEPNINIPAYKRMVLTLKKAKIKHILYKIDKYDNNK